MQSHRPFLVLRIPIHGAGRPAAGCETSTGFAELAHMRAHLRHQAMVLTISGEIDTSNSDRVQSFATRYIHVANALAVDLSAVDFFAAQGVSVLMSVDDACRAAKVPWALVPSRAVSRILQLTDCTTLPTASSVPEALRQFTALSQARRVALATAAAKRRAR